MDLVPDPDCSGTTTSRAGLRQPSSSRAPRPAHLALAGLVLSLQATVGLAQARDTGAILVPPGLSGQIVFRQAALHVDGTMHSSDLWTVGPDGRVTTQLTAATAEILNDSPSWSPHGEQLAHSRANNNLGGKSDIHVLDIRGTNARQVTSGTQDFLTPAWGPRGGLIAFVSRTVAAGVQTDCLGVVQPDGGNQRVLFCPPAGSSSGRTAIQTPSWSADGRSVYFETGYTGTTNDSWYSSIYRVEAASGAPTLLVDQVEMPWGAPPDVIVSPDGRHAVYGERALGIFRIDFATGASTPLNPDGHAPVYSEDGRRIAFTRTINDGDLQYDHLFVMDADGSDVRELTSALVDNLEYQAVDWSKNGTHLLVNRTLYDEVGGQRVNPRRAMRIINADTRAVISLPGGHTFPGAWFEPRAKTAIIGN